MKKRHAQPLLAALAAAVLLLAGPTALEAARSAVRLWLESFLPAMFPFFLLMPFLTGPEARTAFSRLFGGILPGLFGVPGEAASALLTGLVAGSPAGAIACAELMGAMDAAAYERCVFLCSGVSPAFLVTAVGAGAFRSPRAGMILLAAHFFALTVSGLLLRRSGPRKAPGESLPVAEGPRFDPILTALLRLLRVLGWMITFSVLAALLRLALRPIVPEWITAAVCEVSQGAYAAAHAPLPESARLAAAAGACCFGGLCVGAQVVSATGVPPLRLLRVKLLHAATGAAFAFGLARLVDGEAPPLPLKPDPLSLSALAAAGAVLIASIFALAARRGVDEAPSAPYTDT